MASLCHSCQGESLVPEQKDQTQETEAGGRVAGPAAEEERGSTCEPLEGGHSAGQLGGH